MTATPAASRTAAADYRPDIDGLRAIAVLAVIGYHAFPTLVTGGFVGVDVFFVISGFLITSIILRGVETGRFSFVTFYARRVRRIFPALLVVLAFCAIAGWFELWVTEYKLLGKHILGAAAFVSNFVLWKEAGYFDAASESKPLLHLWSLGIEEQFYLVWPFLVWAAFRLRRRVAFLMALILVASFAWNVRLVTYDRAAAYFLPFSRFWELMAGATLAYAHTRGRLRASPRANEGLATLGVLAVGASVLLLNRDSAFPGWWALLPVLGTLLLIAAGAETRFNRYVLSHRAMVYVGLISYPLYLWHWPLLTFLRLANVHPLSIGLRVAAIVASFVCAALTYELLEQRMRDRSPRRVALPLVGALALVGIAGFGIGDGGGVPGRFPKSVRDMDRYALMSPEISREWRRHRCMLETEGAFAPECVDPSPANAPLVVLWGDSHAAALFPGLRDAQAQHGYRLAQFSTSRCPPIVGYVSAKERLRNPQCVPVNQFVVDRIRALRPSVVVLTAYWDIYEPDGLRQTLALLREAGVPRVVVVGNVPIWRDNPARMLFHLYRRTGGDRVPSRVTAAEFRVPYASDDSIARIARDANVEFVSALEPLCDARTCLALAGDSVAYSNSDHLAPPGARYVVTRTLGGVFSGLSAGRVPAGRPLAAGSGDRSSLSRAPM